MKVQERNRRDNCYITYKDETKTLSEWCEIFNIPYARTRERYRKGYPLEKVFAKESFK